MSSVKLFRLSLLCLFIFPALVFSQTKPEPSGEAQDVIKFDTSLVQTDVMVFDKQGRFVDGLKPEQFQLRINKTAREISFFESVNSGSTIVEREQVKSGQPNSEQPNSVNPAKPDAPTRADLQRRAVIFYVDDLHL